MINEKEWEEKLKQFDGDELDEIAKIIKKLKETVDDREEFLSVLRRYSQRYPDAYLFFTGYAGKGAYECEGEWYAGDWMEMDDDWYYKEIFRNRNDKDLDTDDESRKLLKSFKTVEDFKNSIFNLKLEYGSREYKEFEKDLENAKHVPAWEVNDAENLYNGVRYFGAVDIRTGKEYYFYISTY